MTTVGIPVTGVDAADQVETGDRSRRTGSDLALVIGLFAVLAFAAVSFDVFGLGAARDTDPRILALQRVSVYAAVAAGMLGGVRVLAAILTPPAVVFFSYVAWAVFAAAFAAERLGELDRTVWFAGFALLVAMVAVRFGWNWMLIFGVGFGVAFVGGGVVGHLFGWVPSADLGLYEEPFLGFERARGLATHANTFGRSAAFVVLAAVALLLSNDRRSVKALASVGVVVGSVGLVLSQSRFSTLGLSIGLAILLGRRFRAVRIAIAVGVLAAVVGLGALVATGNEAVGSRSGDITEYTTLLGRTSAWAEAAQLARDNPYTGVGIENLREHYGSWEAAGYSEWNPSNAHNTVLQSAASHGLLGAALFVVAMIVGFVRAWRSPHVGVAAILAMFAVHGVAEAILVGNPSLPIMLVIAGFVVVAQGDLDSEAVELPPGAASGR